MTQPIAHGYPDWGRFVPHADSILLDLSAQTINNTTTHDLGFVGNYANLGFFFRDIAQNFSIEVQYFTDSALTNQITEFTYNARSGNTFDGVVPVLGPYARVRLLISAAGAQYDLTVFASSQPAIPGDGSATTNLMVSRNGTAIGASASDTITPTIIRPGQAYWTCHSTAANWTAVLQYIDYQGNVGNLDSMKGTSATVLNHAVFLPACTVQVVFTNGEAAARTYNLHLTARPIIPGA